MSYAKLINIYSGRCDKMSYARNDYKMSYAGKKKSLSG